MGDNSHLWLKKRYGGNDVFQKFIKIVGLSIILLVSQISINQVSAAESDDQELDLAKLQSGEQLEKDGFTVKYYSNEEAAKKIAKDNGVSKESVLKELKGDKNSSQKARTSATANATATGKCATGAVAFSRTLDVTSSYKPKLHIWTELCENSSGQYVIKSIIKISIDRSYNGISKGFNGDATAKALNSGKTLFYEVQGDFYNNESTTAGTSVGLNTAAASVSFNVSQTSNFYEYLYQQDNIRLFD